MKGSIRDRCLRAKEWFPEGSFRRNDNNVEFPFLKAIPWADAIDDAAPVTIDEINNCVKQGGKHRRQEIDRPIWASARSVEASIYAKMKESATGRSWRTGIKYKTDDEFRLDLQDRDLQLHKPSPQLRELAERVASEEKARHLKSARMQCYANTGLDSKQQKAFETEFHGLFLHSPLHDLVVSEQNSLRWILRHQGHINRKAPTKSARIEQLQYRGESKYWKDLGVVRTEYPAYIAGPMHRVAFVDDDDLATGYLYLPTEKCCRIWCLAKMGIEVKLRRLP